MSADSGALSEDGRQLAPIGMRTGRQDADYCRKCQTITWHNFVVASHEWWTCGLCSGEHFSEAWAWECLRCGESGDGWNRFLTILARAGLEPEPVARRDHE